MLKRVTYLWRRQDISIEAFRNHWRTPHGPIAAKFKNLIAYNQNDVVTRPWSFDGAPTAPDGIVELWFKDGVEAPGTDPDIVPLLRADEPRFMSGFTGYELGSDEVPEASAWKLWIRGQWRTGGRDDASLATTADEIARATGITPQVNVIDAATPLFLRDDLRQELDPPRVLLIIGFGPEEPTSQLLEELRVICDGPESALSDTDSLLTQEVRIVDAR